MTRHAMHTAKAVCSEKKTLLQPCCPVTGLGVSMASRGCLHLQASQGKDVAQPATPHWVL